MGNLFLDRAIPNRREDELALRERRLDEKEASLMAWQERLEQREIKVSRAERDLSELEAHLTIWNSE